MNDINLLTCYLPVLIDEGCAEFLIQYIQLYSLVAICSFKIETLNC